MPQKVPVTLSALVQRLKRRHARDGETFHVTRPRWITSIGQWHTVDERNVVASYWHTVNDLEAHGRDLGVLATHEEVVL